MNAKTAIVLIMLMVGTLGGMTAMWDTQEETPGYGITGVVEFDGDDPPPDPDGIPSGDPEHPQGGGGGG